MKRVRYRFYDSSGIRGEWLYAPQYYAEQENEEVLKDWMNQLSACEGHRYGPTVRVNPYRIHFEWEKVDEPSSFILIGGTLIAPSIMEIPQRPQSYCGIQMYSDCTSHAEAKERLNSEKLVFAAKLLAMAESLKAEVALDTWSFKK